MFANSDTASVNSDRTVAGTMVGRTVAIVIVDSSVVIVAIADKAASVRVPHSKRELKETGSLLTAASQPHSG